MAITSHDHIMVPGVARRLLIELPYEVYLLCSNSFSSGRTMRAMSSVHSVLFRCNTARTSTSTDTLLELTASSKEACEWDRMDRG